MQIARCNKTSTIEVAPYLIWLRRSLIRPIPAAAGSPLRAFLGARPACQARRKYIYEEQNSHMMNMPANERKVSDRRRARSRADDCSCPVNASYALPGPLAACGSSLGVLRASRPACQARSIQAKRSHTARGLTKPCAPTSRLQRNCPYYLESLRPPCCPSADRAALSSASVCATGAFI